MTKGEALIELVEQFVQDNKISCADAVYDDDHIIENAYEFIEQCCDMVGYYKYPDGV